jgi:hypothetical protein
MQFGDFGLPTEKVVAGLFAKALETDPRVLEIGHRPRRRTGSLLLKRRLRCDGYPVV